MKIKRFQEINAIRIVNPTKWSLWIALALTNTGYKCKRSKTIKNWLIPFPFTKWGILITLYRYI